MVSTALRTQPTSKVSDDLVTWCAYYRAIEHEYARRVYTHAPEITDTLVKLADRIGVPVEVLREAISSN